jgi:hypothetical protein
MAKTFQKAQVGDLIRVKLEDHHECPPCTIESLGNNSSGRLIYLTTCSCGKKLRLTPVQIERVLDEDR